MNRMILAFTAGLAVAIYLAPTDGTPKSISKTYDSIADSLLAAKQTEANFIKVVLKQETAPVGELSSTCFCQ